MQEKRRLEKSITSKDSWIQAGYAAFSKGGQNELKVELIAKNVGISKSSFYHYFGDIEVFLEALVAFHIQQAHVIAQKEAACQTINPELIDVLVAHKTDLLFNRQLRIKRDNALFNACLEKSNTIIAQSFMAVWQKDLGIPIHPQLLDGLFNLALENFFLQITEDNLNVSWLSAYFENLKKVVRNFK